MVEKRVSEAVLLKAMSTGADYAELYVEDTTADGVSMIADCVDSASTSRSKGAGVRILCGTNSVYAYGNGTDEASLMALAGKVAAAAPAASSAGMDIVLRDVTFEPLCRAQVPVFDVDKKERVEALKQAYFAAKEYSDEIVQVRGSLNASVKRVYLADSEGVIGRDERPYIRLAVSAVASDGSENQSGFTGPGKAAGFEFIRGLDLRGAGREASRIATTMLHAGKCPAGRMSVVMDNAFGGVVFHEACGHALEATAVGLGNSVFCGKLGQKIANEKVTAVDDGTIPGEWGSLSMSDEGEKTQRITLIKDGILTGYMIDKLGSRRMGMPSTGSGRRQDYTFAPTSRMTNTFICAGNDKREDIIASTENGLYAAKMGGGSVNPVTGEFNFAVMEGYMIRGGRICEPVRGATLIGKGYEVLLNIDMVSDDLVLGQGMCGSVSGSIPTNVGQPMIRISEITVGGEIE